MYIINGRGHKQGHGDHVVWKTITVCSITAVKMVL